MVMQIIHKQQALRLVHIYSMPEEKRTNKELEINKASFIKKQF